MNRETTCCFTGPRPLRLPENGNESSPEILSLKRDIRSAVFDAYYEGFRFFMSGMAEGFDLFAAETVLEMKEDFDGICLVAVLPCSDSKSRHSAAITSRIEKILSRADFVFSVSENYFSGCELIRNRYMVDHSSRIIGYYNGLSNGTAHCWKYALEKGLETVNLYESKF
ncbi:MAG: DUF1273 family protein [Oscillospiraceae bacterium]|nr:DUF1273 family protein [Oscillospiraceae bacterium]